MVSILMRRYQTRVDIINCIAWIWIKEKGTNTEYLLTVCYYYSTIAPKTVNTIDTFDTYNQWSSFCGNVATRPRKARARSIQ